LLYLARRLIKSYLGHDEAERLKALAH